MRNYRLSKPPKRLHRSTVHLDNIALIPASLLPNKKHWQRIANELPFGSVLVCLPSKEKQQQITQSVVSEFRKKGKRVIVLGSVFPRTIHRT